LQDAIGIGRINLLVGAEVPAALGVFGLQQVPLAGVLAHDFAAGGYFKPLGHRFPGFNAFGTSHNLTFPSEKMRNIDAAPLVRKRFFSILQSE